MLVLAAVIVLGACGGGGANNSSVKTVTNGEIDVNAYDIHFDVGTIKTAPGKLTVNLHEKGTDQHTFTIDSPHLNLVVNPGTPNASGTVDLKAGTYEFYCATDGHRQAGMHGTIEVS